MKKTKLALLIILLAVIIPTIASASQPLIKASADFFDQHGEYLGTVDSLPKKFSADQREALIPIPKTATNAQVNIGHYKDTLVLKDLKEKGAKYIESVSFYGSIYIKDDIFLAILP